MFPCMSFGSRACHVTFPRVFVRHWILSLPLLFTLGCDILFCNAKAHPLNVVHHPNIICYNTIMLLKDCFSVVSGGVEVAEAVTSQRFDYIFFTGGGSIGKKVMIKAAENLTPLTLELGGKR